MTSDQAPADLAPPPAGERAPQRATTSAFLRAAIVATVALVVASGLVVAAQQAERAILARVELAVTTTPPDQAPSDLDDLDRLAATARAATSRWLAGYLPLVALVTAVGVGAASRDHRRAWLACLLAMTPVAAAGVAVTAAASTWVRLLPVAYVAAAALLATVVAGLAERSGGSRTP